MEVDITSNVVIILKFLSVSCGLVISGCLYETKPLSSSQYSYPSVIDQGWLEKDGYPSKCIAAYPLHDISVSQKSIQQWENAASGRILRSCLSASTNLVAATLSAAKILPDSI